jgi:predicted ATPase
VLTKLQIRNFKAFADAEIELGPVTVLCGPNNSGKTAARQAIALWQLGLKAWQAERGTGLDGSGESRRTDQPQGPGVDSRP